VNVSLTFLITGGSGSLGRELVKTYPESIHPSHNELDITNEKAVLEYVSKVRIDELIHCAALTSIRECEEDKERAYRTNVEGTRNLVRSVSRYNPDCLFVYVSTASVFSGDRGYFTEFDIPYPKNFYNLTKLLAELVVTESGLASYLIVRTNFAPRKKWPYPRAFTDRFATYLFADDLAAAMKQVIGHGLRGIVHVCGEMKLSMFELAKITTPEILPMTMSEYAGPPLPLDMSLRSVRIPSFPLTRKTREAAELS